MKYLLSILVLVTFNVHIVAARPWWKDASERPLLALPVDLEQAKLDNGWEIKIPDWKTLPGSKRARFTNSAMLCADQPEAELTLTFTGTTVGAYVVAGPDAGVLEARVDDGDFTPVNLYHAYSKGLHYPRTVLFGTDLAAGEHVLTLRVSSDTVSGGHAARIVKFVAN